MAPTKNRTLLSAGSKKISSNNVLLAYSIIALPIGSKYNIIKDKEVVLDNPVIHKEVVKSTDAYTYTYTKLKLTVSNELSFNTLIYEKDTDTYYTITRSLPTNEYGIFHYELKMVDLAHILIHNKVEDIDTKKIYDITSIPLLLDLFNKNNIICIPESLFITNPELVKKKVITLRVLDSKTLSQGFSKDIPRIDRIRLFFKNYTRLEVMDTFQEFDRLINRGLLNIIGRENIYNIKEITTDSLVNSITYYVDFELNYILTDEVVINTPILIKTIKYIMNDKQFTVSNKKDK